MATLDEIFSDPKALEAIFRGLIGAGTAAAGIQQATTPQVTTSVRGAPAAASPLEQEALGLGFGTLAAGLSGQGITRTPTGLFFQPTGEEQQSALGLNRALASMNARLGGGPLSLRGPTDALSKASLTRKPAFDRSRLISAIQTKMSAPISATSGQGSVLNLERGQDGVFSLPGGGGGGVFNIPSSFVNLPSSETGAIPRVSSRSGGGGGASSFLPTATGVLGIGAGALQVAKALGLIGSGSATTMADALSSINFPVSAPTTEIIRQAIAQGATPAQIQSLAAADFMRNMPPDLQSVLGMSSLDEGVDIASDLEAIREIFSPLNAPQISGSALGLGTGAGALSPAAEAASPLALESVFGSVGSAAEAGAGTLGTLGAGFLSTLPLSLGIGTIMAAILGPSAAEKWESQAKGWATGWANQIKTNPVAWMGTIEARLPGVGQNLAQAALSGEIKNAEDVIKFLGLENAPEAADFIASTEGTTYANWSGTEKGTAPWASVLVEAASQTDIPRLLANQQGRNFLTENNIPQDVIRQAQSLDLSLDQIVALVRAGGLGSLLGRIADLTPNVLERDTFE